MPDATIGDLNAQFAANAVGGERLKDLHRKFGEKTMVSAMQEMLNYSERRIRAAILKAPDGTFSGKAWLDDDGNGGEPVLIKAEVVINDDQILIDFKGSSDQVRTNLNSPFASSVS